MPSKTIKPRIVMYIAGAEPAPWINRLSGLLPGFDVVPWEPTDRHVADYAVVWNPPEALFAAQKHLKAIFNFGAGVDGILKLPGRPAEVPVIRVEDAGMAVQMAEYVCQAVIRFARGIGEAERAMRERQWREPAPMRRSDFPIGIMGLGVMGARVAQALGMFGYPVLGWSRHEKKLPGVRCYHGAAGLDSFLRQTRILVCLLPLTSETAGILNRAHLEKLQPGGYLINVARGGHLVESDLLELLDEGRLAGAALDVFSTEPLPEGHPFWRHPQIAMTPHIAAQTMPEETLDQIASKIQAMEQGQRVSGIVDIAGGY